MIEGNYEKFSDNFGALDSDMKRDFSEENRGVDLEDAAVLLGRKYVPNEVEPTVLQNANLDIIDEGSEDDEELSDEEEFGFRLEYLGREIEETVDVSKLRPMDYLEAFSHFTFAVWFCLERQRGWGKIGLLLRPLFPPLDATCLVRAWWVL